MARARLVRRGDSEMRGVGSHVVAAPSLASDDDADQSGPWCVDDGSAIEVLSSQQIRTALRSGAIEPSHKAWRDGRAAWEPIAELPELHPRLAAVGSAGWDDDDLEEATSQHSGFRRVVPPHDRSADPAV